MSGGDEGERPDWVDDAVRLTRVALSGVDGAREERDAVAEDRGYEARERDDGTLVLYPQAWRRPDGTVDLDGFDADDAYEIPLEGGDYDEAYDANDPVLERFESEESDVHASNVRYFVEFCENHHAVAVENATVDHVEEFLGDYYVRNVWASEEEREAVDESLRILFRRVGREDLIQATK